VRLPDGRHVIARDPLAVGLAVYLVPQVFVVWMWVTVREWRAVAQLDDGPPRPPRSARRWYVGLLGAAVVGWALLQLPIPPVTFLVPIDALHQWPPGSWWPPWLYWLILSVASAPVALYCQAYANQRWVRSGCRVPEGPALATPSVGIAYAKNGPRRSPRGTVR
jgi:hypothetical protein